jgi:pimeloyl-ACP methyl ester carboxylesterase
VPLPGVSAWEDGTGNARAHAYLLRAGPPDRPCVVVLHGHRMGEPRDLRLLGSLRLHRDLDVDVAHLVLPMHGPRGRDHGTHPFPGLDPVANFLGMAQAVSDTRALLGWLRRQGAAKIGVFGVSLGGHVAAMVAGLEPSLDCVVVGVPTSDVSTMLADTMRARWGEEAVAASHVCDDAFRGLSRLVSPLAFPALVPVERRHIYAAVGDRLVTPQQALALWHHWERCSILWLQGGHIANNVGASRRFVTEALAAAGVAGGVPGR